jgi:hypothetical protein
MKSTIFSILPIVGFALAQEGCTRRTVTKTETERTYVTVQPSPVPSDITITSTIGKTFSYLLCCIPLTSARHHDYDHSTSLFISRGCSDWSSLGQWNLGQLDCPP